MRHDEQIKAALYTKKFATIASGWGISVGDDANNAALDTQKKFLEFNFGEMDGTVETFLLDALTALEFGLCCRASLQVADYGEFDGLIGWRALKVRRPEQIEFETDQYRQSNRRLHTSRQREDSRLTGSQYLHLPQGVWKLLLATPIFAKPIDRGFVKRHADKIYGDGALMRRQSDSRREALSKTLDEATQTIRF